MKNDQNIPNLRFMIFEGEWQIKLMKDIFFKVSERNIENKYTNVLTNSATQGIVNQLDFFNKDIANQNNLLNYYVVDLGYFVYNPRISNYAPVGPLKRNNLIKGIMSPLYTIIKPKQDNSDFFEKYFQTKFWHKYMYKIANYGARFDRMSILSEDFFKMPLPFPQIEEQQKIASFLIKVDEWVGNLKEQKENLEKYKKGMMQKIFSQKIRFKDKNKKEFDGWRKYKLGELIKESNEKTKINNQHKVLSSTMNGVVLQSEYFNKTIASSDSVGYKVLKRNQLVFSPQNLWLGNINFCDKFDIGIVSPSYKIYDVKEKLILLDYFKNIIKLPRMIYEYTISSEQGASVVRRGLNMDLFNVIPINLPFLPEQQKIAGFFTSIDKLIDLKQNQIARAEEWKKGLMQGLFV